MVTRLTRVPRSGTGRRCLQTVTVVTDGLRTHCRRSLSCSPPRCPRRSGRSRRCQRCKGKLQPSLEAHRCYQLDQDQLSRTPQLPIPLESFKVRISCIHAQRCMAGTLMGPQIRFLQVILRTLLQLGTPPRMLAIGSVRTRSPASAIRRPTRGPCRLLHQKSTCTKTLAGRPMVENRSRL